MLHIDIDRKSEVETLGIYDAIVSVGTLFNVGYPDASSGDIPRGEKMLAMRAFQSLVPHLAEGGMLSANAARPPFPWASGVSAHRLLQCSSLVSRLNSLRTST